MGTSHPEGRPWICERIIASQPARILDVGAGSGTYIKALRAAGLPDAVRVDAVEVWRPYIDQFNLLSLYDDVYEQDIRQWPASAYARYDVVIFGDVLEHMSRIDAVVVWQRAADARMRVLSIPIIPYPQGALNGNPYEVHHVEDWTHERVLETFSGITDSWTGEIEGAYISDRRARA